MKFSKSLKARKERMNQILEILKKEYPKVTIQLNFGDPHQLLVATILSAQCTDERVNKVTSELFLKYQKIEDFANAASEQLEKDIYSTGYYKAKAKHIIESSRAIIDDFGGEVPDNMQDLLKLPGVGRKTANVILGHCFGVPGIVVDTHVIRQSNRLGFTNTKNAEKIEREMQQFIDEEDWVLFTHIMINHGRKICKARKPNCPQCKITHLCPSAEFE